MKYIQTFLLALLLTLLAQDLAAQRILGYYPYYRSGTYNSIEFDKLTDVVYAFLNADNSGNLQLSDSFITADFNGMVAAARAQNPNVKIHISSGGWNLTAWLYPVASSPTARANFVTNMADFMVNNDIDGWDLDWEFPYTVAEQAAHVDLLAAMRAELDAREQLLCRKFDISMAVGGDGSASGHINYYQAAAINYVDFVSIMSYDDGGRTNHSSMVFAQEGIDGYYNTLGWPKSKMMLGAPFYGRGANGGGAETFAGIAGANPAAAYNSDNYGGTYHYNGMPTLEAKVDLIMNEGGQGITIWELAQDRMGQTYSLLDGLDAYMKANYGTPAADVASCCQVPDLGPDLSSCDSGFPITLNSRTLTNTNVDFTWKKMPNMVLTMGAAANTYEISETGTYVVVRDSMDCSQTDTIIVSNSLAQPQLATSVHLCSPSAVDLSPTNLSTYGAVDFQWYKDAVLMEGETTATLSNVRMAGVYELKISSAGCGTGSASTTVTSDMPMPLDACVTAGQTADLSVTGMGPYSWYAQATGGTSVASGATFTTPSLNATTTYYVQDDNAFATTVGPATTGNGLGTENHWLSPTELQFDALSSFNLKEFTILALIWSSTHDITVEIRDASGTLLPNGAQTFTLTAMSAGPAFQTVSLNGSAGVYIPQGNGYKIVLTSGVGIGHWSGASYPMSDGSYVSITGSNAAGNYLAIHDWKIEGGNSCERLPVVANVGTCSRMELDVVAFLQGTYDNQGAMTTALNVGGFLPLQEPYTAMGWHNLAEQTTAQVLADKEVVDWVLVELRDALDNSIIVESQAGLLLKNGSIRDLNGTDLLQFDVALGDYFVAIRHRNHIGLMTATARALAIGTTVDFRTVPINGGAAVSTTAGDGTRLLWSGNATPDGSIDASDRSETWNLRNQSGYFDADVNCDGVVDATDRSITWNNRNKVEVIP